MDIPWEDYRYEDIKTRAWLKWKEAGCPPGDGVQFWLAAEKEYNEDYKLWFAAEREYVEDYKFLGKMKIYVDPPIQVKWDEPPIIKTVIVQGGYKGDSHIDNTEVLPWCGTNYPTEETIIKDDLVICEPSYEKPINSLPPKGSLSQRLSKWWKSIWQ